LGKKETTITRRGESRVSPMGEKTQNMIGLFGCGATRLGHTLTTRYTVIK